MSLKKTLHSKSWNAIPKKCKQCRKATYTLENNMVLYQCSLYGTFKRQCEVDSIRKEQLFSIEEIRGE